MGGTKSGRGVVRYLPWPPVMTLRQQDVMQCYTWMQVEICYNQPEFAAHTDTGLSSGLRMTIIAIGERRRHRDGQSLCELPARERSHAEDPRLAV